MHRVVLYAAEHPDTEIGQIASALDLMPVTVQAIADALARERLVVEDQRLAADALALNPAGEGRARAWDAAYHQRARRVTACRSALLEWLYEGQPTAFHLRSALGHDLRDDPRGYFYGRQFSEAEIDGARGFLGDEALILGTHVAEDPFGHLSPEVTSAGKMCVERYGSDVGAYLDRTSKEQSVQNFTTNVHGSSGFQVANASPGASITSTVTITDDHRQQLLALTREMADQVADFPSEHQQQAQEALEEAEAAVQDPAAPRGRVRAAFEKIAVAGAVAFSTDTGKALAGLAGKALGIVPS